MSAVAPALLAAGGLADINFGLTVWTIVLFALFAWVLSKFGWGPLLHLIEERERSIREGVLGAEKANAEAQSLLEQHKQMLRDASREREEILKRALQEAEALKADVTARARSESEQMVSKAREQIGREKDQAIHELRAQVADLAIEAASRIVVSSMTEGAQRKLVDEFISGLPKA